MVVWAGDGLGRPVTVAGGFLAAAVVAAAIMLLPLTWATVLVAAGIGVVVILVRPQFGLLLLVPAIPFGSLVQVRVGIMNLGVTEVLVLLVLAAWLMRLVARREIQLGRLPLLWPLLALLAALSLSLLGTASLPHSAKEILKWIEVLVVYVFVSREMDGRWMSALVFVILATGALAAVHGIYQFLFQVGPESFVLFDRFMRAFGTFEQPNPYGGYLGLVLPLALGFLLSGIVMRRWDDITSKWHWLSWAGVCGGLMMVALVMSWSRGAWLGFAAAVLVMILAIVVRSGRTAVLGTVLAVLAGCLMVAVGLARVPSSVVQRFSDFIPYVGVLDVEGKEVTDANFAVLERLAHWQAAWDMWTDQPWLGVGIGAYEAVYSRYALPLWPSALGHAHNYYLNVAAETGLVGLVTYLCFWGAAVVTVWKATQSASGWRLGVALGCLGMLAHLSVHNLFDNLFVHGMYLHTAILLGVTISPLSRRSDTADALSHHTG